MTGHAWQWEIPHELRGLKSTNYLEFLACITGSLLDLFECGSKIPPGSAELNIGDNASSLGWPRKSNFTDNKEQASHSTLACFCMGTMASHAICQCSQWFAGTKNDVADLLSREFSSSDLSLTCAVSKQLPFADASRLLHQSAATRNCLHAGLLGAAQVRVNRVTSSTHSKTDTSWKQWIEFLHCCKLINDPFLDHFNCSNCHAFLRAFTQKVREQTWSKSTKGCANLVVGSCHAAINGACTAFIMSGQHKPLSQ